MSLSEIRSGLDTSVVMRLLTGDPEPLYRQAIAYLGETQALEQRLLVSNLVIAEAYFACQFHYKMPKKDVLSGLYQLLSKPIFAVEQPVIELLGQPGMAKAKPGFVDRLIHLEYSGPGASLVTFEKASSKLDRVHVLVAGTES